MTLSIPLLGLLACSGDRAQTEAAALVEAQRAYQEACQGPTATLAACRTHCAQLMAPQERTDCLFQLAEASPRWSGGDVRTALELAYSVCSSSQDFAAQCFRHALHEIAITCNARGVAWANDPTYRAGDRWTEWQACVSRLVLQRQDVACLAPVRSSYHNVWNASDAPLCGM